MRLMRKNDSADVVDLSLLQKKGILKRAGYENKQAIDRERDVIDFTAPKTNDVTPSNVGTNNSIFGFLDNAANNQSSSSSVFNSSNDSSDINALKLKIDNLEYKLQNLIDKIERMESNLKF